MYCTYILEKINSMILNSFRILQYSLQLIFYYCTWISTHFGGRRRVRGLGQESGRNLIIFWCRLIEEYIYMYIYRVYVYDMYTVYIHLWYVYGLLGRYLPKAVYWVYSIGALTRNRAFVDLTFVDFEFLFLSLTVVQVKCSENFRYLILQYSAL